MDSIHASPVLVQRPALPHTLSPQIQSRTPTSHLPELLLTPTSPPHQEALPPRADIPQQQQTPMATSQTQPEPQQLPEPPSTTRDTEDRSSQLDTSGTGQTSETTSDDGNLTRTLAENAADQPAPVEANDEAAAPD